jgi:hypothetical protein
MAQKTFRGDAVALAQTQDYTFGGTWEVDDEVRFTINGKVVVIPSGSTVIATILANVVAAFNALDTTVYPEFSGEITASVNGTTKLRLTAITAGVPFIVAVTTTEAGGGAADAQTISAASVVQASQGPHHYDVAANWDPSGIPANGDDIDLSRISVAILYGIDQSAVTPGSFEAWASFTGPIGLKDFNDAGYYEYRTKQLTFAAITNGAKIGYGPGQGSGRMRLKVTSGATATTFDVAGTAQPEVDGSHSLQLETGGAANVVNVSRGSVEIAGQDGQSATVATLRVSYQGNQASDADVLCGKGCALTTVEKTGGRLETNSTITSLTQSEGESGDTIHQAGAMTTLLTRGGRVIYNSTGALGTPNLEGTALLDFSQDQRPKIVTNPIEINSADAHVFDPHKVVNGAGSLVMDYNHVAVQINGTDIGADVRLTRAATA